MTDNLPSLCAQGGREIDQIVFGEALPLEGGGFVGNGCVGDVCSPGTVDCGTGRSSIGHTGLPVARSNT